jgi:parallel beta-helix repeat protein
MTQDQSASYPVIRIGNEVTDTLITENELIDGYAGVGLAAASYGNTISNNNIYGYYSGVTFGGSYDNKVLNNHIYDSVYGVWFKASRNYGDSRDTFVDDNLIQGNTIENVSEGVRMDLSADGNKILDNTFDHVIELASGIHIGNNQTNLTIAYNEFTNSRCSLSVSSDVSTPIDATLNWWGTATGPESGDSICPSNGIYDPNYLVTYEPFLTKESYATLDPITEVITDIGELGKSGLADAEGDPTSTPSVTFIHDITLSVATPGGDSTISFEEGTVVTKTDGGNFDATALTASGVTTGALSGFATGTVVNGAFQWGIPQIGLTFDPAITLNIFVGTDLNGRTLSVQRSVSGSTGWSNDGIVEPKTCVVTDGYCTFQATKASYYAATTTGTLPVTGKAGAVAVMTRYLAQ